MDRTSRILQMALNRKDESTLCYLNIPKYESKRGLSENEADTLLSNRHKLFNGDTKDLTLPGSSDVVQNDQISSTEKKYMTRLQVGQIKRKLFCTSKDQTGSISDDHVVTSSIGNTHESDSEKDEELDSEYSEDEFVPESDITSDSESNYNSDNNYFSKILLKRKKPQNIMKLSASNNSQEKDIDQEAQTHNDDNEKPNSLRKNSSKRLWNKRDYCFFCCTDVLKFSRHIMRHHHSEIEVQEILALNVRDKRRKNLFAKLRNRGNFLKSAGDVVVPVRKPTLNDIELPSIATHLPCKYCKGFYKKKYLYRHVKKCPHNYDDKSIRINAQTDGQSLFSACRNDDILRREIFPIMKPDSISFAAKTDPLICAVARRYLKSHRDRQFRLVASRKMRQLAALLIELKKKIKVKSLLDAMDPLNFDVFVECTKIISKYDSRTESYGAPSLAANMGTQLKDCIDVAYNLLLKNCSKGTEDTDKLKTLKELITNEWRYEISTLANNDLQQKKWNKPSLIPLAEDLTLFKAYLNAECEKNKNELEQNPKNEKAFKTLQELCYVQLILLNRRRVGELQRMTVASYISNINNQSSGEFDACISESEKILLKSFRRVVIRGKRGRGVPVLFTEDMVKSTNILLKLRQNFVCQNNTYLFANTKSTSSISGTKAIYKHVRLAGVKNAAALTSTKLRKHLATMSQVINLSEQDLEQLANFMGHTSNIHKTYYRLPNDIYQMAKVSKLLILNERGEASKYKGKTLDEINLDLDAIEDSSDDEEVDEDLLQQDVSINSNEKTRNTDTNARGKQPKPGTIVTQKKRRILEPWTERQKQITLSNFKDHLKKKIPPKKDECLLLQRQNPDLLANKDWKKIKIFVVNNYMKQK